MKPDVFIITATKAGRSRKFIWDSTHPIEVDLPKSWVLEKVKNTIQAKHGQQVIPVSAATIEKGTVVTLPSQGKRESEVALKIQHINHIRAAYLNDPVYKNKDLHQEMQLFASFGVGKFLVDYQPFKDAYVGYVRKKPVFTFVRSSNGSQIKALLDEMKIKFKGESAKDLELGKPLMVTDQQLLDSMIMRGNHWWRIHTVAMPKALTPEQMKTADFDPESKSFKKLLKSIGIAILLFLLLILMIPKSEEKKEEVKPEPIKVSLKKAQFQRAIPRGEPKEEVGIRADGDAENKPELSAPKSDNKEKLEAMKKAKEKAAEKNAKLKAERQEKEKELAELREKRAQEKAAEKQKRKEEAEKLAQERAAERQKQREENARRAAEEKAERARSAAQAQLNQFKGAFGGIASKKVGAESGGGSPSDSGVFGSAGSKDGKSVLGGGDVSVGPGRYQGGGGNVAKFGGGTGTGDGSPHGKGSSGVSYGSGDKGIANGKGGAFVPVEPGGIKADTGLTKNEIGEVIYRKRSEVRYCYEAALIRKTGLEGKVVVQFTIMASGLVKTAAVEDSSVDDPILEQCIINHLKRWKFPKTRGGVEVGVSYPFVFKILGKE